MSEMGGAWNVTGRPMPMRDLLGAISAATGAAGEVCWLPPAASQVAGAALWTDVPLMARDMPALRHVFDVDEGRARAAGLTARPLAETLGPLADWDRGRRDVDLTSGMSAEQEERVLMSEARA